MSTRYVNNHHVGNPHLRNRSSLELSLELSPMKVLNTGNINEECIEITIDESESNLKD